MAIVEFKYKVVRVEIGHTNRTSYVNLSKMQIVEKPISEKMKKTFTGGRGFNF
jgi:hypothetical protein